MYSTRYWHNLDKTWAEHWGMEDAGSLSSKWTSGPPRDGVIERDKKLSLCNVKIKLLWQHCWSFPAWDCIFFCSRGPLCYLFLWHGGVLCAWLWSSVHFCSAFHLPVPLCCYFHSPFIIFKYTGLLSLVSVPPHAIQNPLIKSFVLSTQECKKNGDLGILWMLACVFPIPDFSCFLCLWVLHYLKIWPWECFAQYIDYFTMSMVKILQQMYRFSRTAHLHVLLNTCRKIKGSKRPSLHGAIFQIKELWASNKEEVF